LFADLLLSWREGVSASNAGDGAVVVAGPHRRLALRRLTPAVQRALCGLTPPGEEEHRLAELVADANGGLARWYYYLERLTRSGLLCHCAHAERTPLATLVAISPGYVAQRAAITAEQRYVLSRFAYLHRIGADMVLESPLAHARVVLNDGRAADLIARLNAPVTLGELGKQVDNLGSPSIGGVLALLAQAGMLQAVSEAGTTSEDNDPALQTWEFHDLLFHARSRSGRSDSPCGATFRLLGRVEPPPVLKQPPTGAVHVLYRPDLARLQRDDPPFAYVQECRQTVRDFDEARPITADQLGEFLFRVGRVRERRTMEYPTPHGSVRMDVAGRPFPAGGGLYELEFYVVVISCAPLAGGLYHYDPAQHQLVGLDTHAEDVAALARDASESTGIRAEELQALIVLAARFPRIAWKYQSIAYALTLKHVGVVYQTMYLAATAMGLAACAVGGGDADRFARAASTAYAAETSVGEFLLGSRLPTALDREP
jgi:oxazoline/thiazoline dehydrogenase